MASVRTLMGSSSSIEENGARQWRRRENRGMYRVKGPGRQRMTGFEDRSINLRLFRREGHANRESIAARGDSASVAAGARQPEARARPIALQPGELALGAPVPDSRLPSGSVPYRRRIVVCRTVSTDRPLYLPGSAPLLERDRL